VHGRGRRGGGGQLCVFYIPTAPFCRKNWDYLVKQKQAFVQGMTPPDFPNNNCEVAFPDRAFPRRDAFLSKEGETAMGLELDGN